MLIYLVGNVIDKTTERVISKEDALEKVRENGFEGYFETSAKTGAGIKESFRKVAKHIYHQNKDRLSELADEENR